MMYLDDIVLDYPYKPQSPELIPYLEQGLSELDANRQNYQDNWKMKRVKFSRQTRCLSAMYARLLGRYKNQSCAKIVIECVDLDMDNRIINFSGVCVTQINFNYDRFIELCDYEKRKTTYILLHNGMENIIKHEGWDPTLFLQTEELIKNSDYKNIWYWKKPVKNKLGYKASIICKHEIGEMNLFLELIEPKGDRSETLVASTDTHELDYIPYLGKLFWEKDTDIVFIDKNGHEVFRKSIIDLEKLVQ